ncbi:hypothetical protein [Pseudooceanicola atlanticus]|uniref:Uncharacterized protein n=1 Tax=Pseudooceanicola atlanticus TaxID=1461694 RepID=A0A0A0EBI0_9RHOB|nr:hypothetical protein [Pseudooceanicola atlanticus]KGM47448.1 hypothetical protein ATO9_17615 [Pseudooceanicola atlanticus]
MNAIADTGLRRGAPVKRAVSIEALIGWAFQREFASVDFDQVNTARDPSPNVGMEYIILKRAELGCRVDGGGRSDPHPDADAVADALSVLPEGVGGRAMALRIAELARLGQSHDWGNDTRLSCRPRAWRRCKHGEFAETEPCGEVKYLSRGRVRRVELRVCPVVYYGHSTQVATLRKSYMLWVMALRDLRDTFRIYGGLTSHEVTAELPPLQPWREIV